LTSCTCCVQHHQRAPRDHQDEKEREECESPRVSERGGERNKSVRENAEEEDQSHQKERCCGEEGGATATLEELTESRDQRRGEGVAKVWC
jgi:hypothetical protein